MKRSVGNRESKGARAAVLSAVLLAAVAAAGHAGVFDGLTKKSPAAVAKAAGVAETADAVKIPLKGLDSGKALFLSMEADGRRLRYFALRSPDGRYRAAFDACDVCFRADLGYRQEGERMICNNCGMKFASDKIGDRKGGCNPHPLAHREEAGHMLIRKADIAAGKGYFAAKRQ